MNSTDTALPESVYRFASDESITTDDGLVLPPFSRKVVERIAETMPEWASFDDTAISGDVLASDHSMLIQTWHRRIGDRVEIAQEARYELDGNFIESDDPVIQVWGGDPRKYGPEEARTLGINTLIAAARLEQIMGGDKPNLVREQTEGFPNTWADAEIPSSLGGLPHYVTLCEGDQDGLRPDPVITIQHKVEAITIADTKSVIGDLARLIAIAEDAAAAPILERL